jgi:hypothetical protein
MPQWIGNGVLRHKNRDFHYGEEIPIKELDKDMVQKWKNAGLIGEVPRAYQEMDKNDRKDKSK